MFMRCEGGPANGRVVNVTDQALFGVRIAVPIVEFPDDRPVKLHDEIEWEEDPITGEPVRKDRPQFGQALYTIEGNRLLHVGRE